MNVLLFDWLVSNWPLDGAKGVIFRVISVWLELGGWNGVIFRVIFPNDDDSRPEVDKPEVVSEEPERAVLAGFENGLAVCFALRNGLLAGGSSTVVPDLLMVPNLIDDDPKELGLSVVVPKTLLDFVSPKIDETFFSSLGGAVSNELFPKTDPLELETGPLPNVGFDFGAPRSILGCPKIGFSDWLSIAGGGFPKSTLGCTGGGTEKSPLGGAVVSGTEAGREAGFLKIPKVGSVVGDSSLTEVNFDAVKPVKPLFSALGPPKICFADVEAF